MDDVDGTVRDLARGERFQSWGGEDTDRGYRLQRDGATFLLRRAAAALHCRTTPNGGL